MGFFFFSFLGGLGEHHWRELPQVSFLSRQKFCRNKHAFVETNMCLSRQNNICRDKTFVTTKTLYRDKHGFARQKYSCGKHTFVAIKDVFCRHKHVFVATETCLLRQNFCRDKNDTRGSSPMLAVCTRIFSVELCLLKQSLFPTLLLDRTTS